MAGDYDLSEEGPDGHAASDWECVDADGDPADMVDDDTVELEVGDDVTCTITNTAIAPELTLVKVAETARPVAPRRRRTGPLSPTAPGTGDLGEPAVRPGRCRSAPTP